jgi:hypothetical protein
LIFDDISVSESLRFPPDVGEDGSVVEFVGIESIIYKVALFFVAFVISLHYKSNNKQKNL